jgi:BTB/POZ domain/SPRY domain
MKSELKVPSTEKPVQFVDMIKCPIITFDVGGQVYCVSKDLLQKFPDTLLCRAASDITMNNHDDPIFIKRNGHRFQYVLDYMRDSRILGMIDHNICKEALYKDLDFFGFENYRDGNKLLPKDVKRLDGVQYHQIVWDSANTTYGLIFQQSNKIIRSYSNGENAIFGSEWYTKGIHYWCFEIQTNYINVYDRIEFGVAQVLFAGSYLLPYTYHKKCNDQKSLFDLHSTAAQHFNAGDVIGTLLDMDRKTVTFYHNGEKIAVNDENSILQGNVYFPYVCFYRRDQQLLSLEI